MISGKKNISDWFASTKKPYWFLYEYNKVDSGKRKGSSSEAEGASHSDAVNDLNIALSRISYGKYTLVATEKPGNLPTRGFLHEDFEISPFESSNTQNSQSPSIGAIPDGYVKSETVDQMISKALADYQNKTELERLKKENDQLKKDLRTAETQDGFSRLAGIAADLFPMYKDKLIPAMAGIGNIPEPLPAKQEPMTNTTQDEVVDLTPEQNERLSLAIGAFVEAAPTEWLEILEKMAAKVRNNPGVLGTLKTFL